VPETDAPEPPDDPFLAVVVPAVLAGERVDRGVAMVSGCTRSEASDLIAAGAVWIDGAVVVKASQRLDEDSALVLAADPHREPEPLRADDTVEFEVVYSDDDIIVIDKPAGLVVHPGPGHQGSTLVHGLLARFPDLDPDAGVVVGEAHRPGLVHRLDRGTSGLMVVARTPDAHADLVEQLSTHAVERVYTALVWGHPAHDHAIIDAPVGRSRRNPLRMTVAIDGRPARTHVTVDERFDSPWDTALLTCELETGRTHQIRVHLDSIGHAVVGDDLYGARRGSVRLDRPFLHARRLEFVHPATGESVAFESSLPPDLRSVLDGLVPVEPS
jgi:23S rRNA pseudouridine1911/1915/1917 synthase